MIGEDGKEGREEVECKYNIEIKVDGNGNIGDVREATCECRVARDEEGKVRVVGCS